jgi:hypothetical protein
MKNSNFFNALMGALFLAVVSFVVACQVEPTVTPTAGNDGGKNCDPISQSDLNLHNRIMANVLDGNISSATSADLVNGALDIIEQERGKDYDRDAIVKEAVAYADNYTGAPTSSLIARYAKEGLISANEREAMDNINGFMGGADQNTLSECLSNLSTAKARYVDNNKSLSACERTGLNNFISICSNSAELYYRYTDGSFQGRSSFWRCIKNNIWKILAEDALGVSYGLKLCAVFPKACPIVIPLMIAAGSGFAIVKYCG